VTLGDAAGDNITVTGTITSDLKFTDATYDIGKSGATRPRDLFLSRNATIGGTLGVTGTTTLGALVATTGQFSSTLTPQALVDISGASAGQIKFPATQNAASDVNTLDDYEEGTWTPVIGGAGGTSGQTYVANGQVGHYVKVGKLVTVQFRAELSAKGTITGNVEIQGLPFTPDASTNMLSIGTLGWINLASNWVNIIWRVSTTTAAPVAGCQAAAATNFTALTTSDIGNTTVLTGTLTYKTNA
jgi:hypothetical protein